MPLEHIIATIEYVFLALCQSIHLTAKRLCDLWFHALRISDHGQGFHYTIVHLEEYLTRLERFRYHRHLLRYSSLLCRLLLNGISAVLYSPKFGGVGDPDRLGHE